MADDYEDGESIIEEAVEFFRLCEEAETTNRQEALEAVRFRSGEQWPAEIQNSRQLESRPCLTINKTDSFVRQVCNQQRQQRPRMKAHGVNTETDEKLAEIVTGLCRHIEVNSDADQAYDTAFESAVTMGWGYWRLVTDYVREDSFDQEIFIRPIDNAFSVYFDQNSILPDGSDAERCLITEDMPKETFRKFYPGKDDGANFRDGSTGDSRIGWVTKENIRVAEYFRVTRESDILVLLSNKKTVFKSQLKPQVAMALASAGITVVGERKSFRRVVKWCKLTALEVLEEREWPGRWIPVVPVYGNVAVIDGKRKKFGIVKNAMDPQRMYNFWRTSITETIALAPKAKWLLAEGQDEGHENEWAQANIKALPTLRYKQTDTDGKEAPMPQRVAPEMPPAGAMEAAAQMSNDLQAVVGIVDPAMKIAGNVSGKALLGERQQADNSTFHYYDNLTRSIRHTGKAILDLLPKIYDTERVARIIGADGKPDLVTINEMNEAGDIVANNITIGEYDIVMDTGPGYNTKRQEAVESMMPLFQGNEELMKVAGDIMFRNMDFPGAEVIADRLAAANPLAQIDDKSDVPPQAQMAIKALQQQLQQAQQALQAAEIDKKYRLSTEKMRQDAETQRAHMNNVTKAHDTEVRAQTAKADTAMKERTALHDIHAKVVGAQNVEEIKAAVQLMLHHLSGAQIETQPVQ